MEIGRGRGSANGLVQEVRGESVEHVGDTADDVRSWYPIPAWPRSHVSFRSRDSRGIERVRPLKDTSLKIEIHKVVERPVRLSYRVLPSDTHRIGRRLDARSIAVWNVHERLDDESRENRPKNKLWLV